MKIQIASDLHLERFENWNRFQDDNPIKPQGDVLVLAGDIFNIHKSEEVEFFIDFCKDNFKKVIHIPGNHEYYGNKFNSDDKILEEQDNYTYCNNQVIEFEDTRFVCSTLWSGVSEMTHNNYLNDSVMIKGFALKTENNAHKRAKDFLAYNLSTPYEGNTVAVTHHLPLWRCVSQQYIGAPGNDGFASDQDELFDNEIDLWVHGHSHDFQTFTHKDTIVVRNPYGYRGIGMESIGFVGDCVIDI
jgi:predicted phosphodiesterase